MGAAHDDTDVEVVLDEADEGGVGEVEARAGWEGVHHRPGDEQGGAAACLGRVGHRAAAVDDEDRAGAEDGEACLLYTSRCV